MFGDCDETVQPIENMYDFNKSLEEIEDDINVRWEQESISYLEEPIAEKLRFTDKVESEPKRSSTIRYTQQVGFVAVSADFLPFDTQNKDKQNFIMRFLLNKNADESRFIGYGLRDDVVTLEYRINTDKDCSAYMVDLSDVRTHILRQFNDLDIWLIEVEEAWKRHVSSLTNS